MNNIRQVITDIFDRYNVPRPEEQPESKCRKICRVALRAMSCLAPLGGIGYLTHLFRLGMPLFNAAPLVSGITLALSAITFIGSKLLRKPVKQEEPLAGDQMNEFLLNEWFLRPEHFEDLDRARKALKTLGFNLDEIDHMMQAITSIFEQKKRLVEEDCFAADENPALRDALQFLTADEIAAINQKFVSFFLDLDTPINSIEDLDRYAHYLAILTPENKSWIIDVLKRREFFVTHFIALTNSKKLSEASILREIQFLEENSPSVYFELCKNSHEWRNYFHTLACMGKEASPEMAAKLANALHSAVGSNQLLTDFVSEFKTAENSYEFLVEILKRPAPHGQNALNIAVAFGMINLSEPLDLPLLHALGEQEIPEVVFNRLTSTLRYNRMDLNALDANGDTLLHKAIKNNNFLLFRALVLNGASICITDKDNKTVLTLAQEIYGIKSLYYQTLLLSFTEHLVVLRLNPLNVLPLSEITAPIAEGIKFGENIKELKQVNNFVSRFRELPLNNKAIKVAGNGFGFVANVCKIKEKEVGYEAQLRELRDRKRAIEDDLKSPSILTAEANAKRRKLIEITNDIDQLEELKYLESNRNYVEASGTALTLLKTFMKSVTQLAKIAPGVDVAVGAFDVYQQKTSLDQAEAKKVRDENTLMHLQTETVSLFNMRNSFPPDFFVHKLLNLRLQECEVKKCYLSKRLEKHASKATDAKLGVAALVGKLASFGLLFTPFAVAVPTVKGISAALPYLNLGYNYVRDSVYPPKVPKDEAFQPIDDSEYNESFKDRCAKRLSLSSEEMNNQLNDIVEKMLPDEKDWFVGLLNHSGIACTREDFGNNPHYYVLRFVVD